MSKHTPGPWRVHRHHKPISDEWVFTVVTDEEYGGIIGGTCTSPQRDEAVRLADATLMAASPKLLAALAPLADTIMAMENSGMLYPHYQLRLGKEAAAQIVAAVRAARGEQ